MNPSENQVQLTEEDLIALKKCRKISFWRGSVPFTIGACMAVTLAQKMTYFANRPKLRIPSYLIATFVGYFGGKLVYLGECKRMFLELSDSRIKDQLLQFEKMRGFGYGTGGVGSNGGPGMGDNTPIIVNTPVDKNSSSPNKSMTYAERRNFYRNQEHFSSQPSRTPSTPFTPPSVESNAEMIDDSHQSMDDRASYFDPDKPTSSFLYDDVYRPRD